MPINAHPEYIYAEKEFHQAQTLEEQLKCLEKMISHAPAHKGGENLRAQLRTRHKKLKEKIVKNKKSGKSNFKGIKKEDMQAVLIGNTNTGKSSILKILTNAQPRISERKITTFEPIIGIMNYASVQIQLIENPAIESDYYNKGLTNSADTLLIIITDLDQIKEIEKQLEKAQGKKIIIFNKSDKLSTNEKRKISATLQSKKHNFILISTDTKENLEELKEKIFQSFDKLRIYTKEPNKEKSIRPMILKPNSTIKDVAEKILKGFYLKIKETKIWGPSSKFPGQKVGLKHKIKDMDVVEFKTG